MKIISIGMNMVSRKRSNLALSESRLIDLTYQEGTCDMIAFDFLENFADAAQSTDNWTRLANNIRFFCLSFNFGLRHADIQLKNPWSIFTRFQNLEHLELTGKWPYEHTEWDIAVEAFNAKPQPHLNKLHTVCLRGYLPQDFVQYICHGASNITSLELAILDRPIGSTLLDTRENPPPGKQEDSEVDSDALLKGNDDTGSDDDSDAEDFDEEQIAPRALAALKDSDLIERFTSISRLSLCRPAESAQPLSPAGLNDVYVSLKSEQNILTEWAQLIRSTRSSVEHLILAQWPFAEDIEVDGTVSKEFLVYYTYGPGYHRFVEHALPALLEDGEWPKLKSIRFYRVRPVRLSGWQIIFDLIHDLGFSDFIVQPINKLGMRKRIEGRNRVNEFLIKFVRGRWLSIKVPEETVILIAGLKLERTIIVLISSRSIMQTVKTDEPQLRRTPDFRACGPVGSVEEITQLAVSSAESVDSGSNAYASRITAADPTLVIVNLFLDELLRDSTTEFSNL
ncbi:hypothetical protein G7Y89_g9986 [Cudoniella acicularis]|uniref:Uncharacterized protein n=1 Tax=Cudoniella acicularis TaxID=354080 RepID=A0A8H4RHA6_9HELO|nr:hypothetical protein G7Y89_g9986 [Cudoniella acicularis]